MTLVDTEAVREDHLPHLPEAVRSLFCAPNAFRVFIQGVKALGVNSMYKSIGGGRTRLSDRGRAYHNTLTTHISQAMLDSGFEPRTQLYHFYMAVGKPSLVSESFVKEAKQAIKQNRALQIAKVKNKKKKNGEVVQVIERVFTSLLSPGDVDGPLKHTQDVMFEVLGIDDGCVMSSTCVKFVHPVDCILLGVIPIPEEEALSLLQVSREVYQKWTQER